MINICKSVIVYCKKVKKGCRIFLILRLEKTFESSISIYTVRHESY